MMRLKAEAAGSPGWHCVCFLAARQMYVCKGGILDAESFRRRVVVSQMGFEGRVESGTEKISPRERQRRVLPGWVRIEDDISNTRANSELITSPLTPMT